MAEDVVKVSADTIGVADALRAIREELLGLRKDAAAVGADVKTATAPLKELGETAKAAGEGVSGLVDFLKENKIALVALGVAATAAVAVLGLLAQAYHAIKERIEDAIQAGIAFNASLETGRLGLTATILTFKDLVTAQGEVLSGQPAYAAGMRIAADAQEQLKASAFRTTATFQELVGGFQKLYAAASRGSATTQEIVKLTETAANMATVLQVPYETAFRQLTLALNGVSRATGQVGVFLKSLGIDNQTLHTWIAQGDAVQRLTEKLSEFEAIGPKLAATYSGVMSNLQDALQQLGQMASLPIFEAIKTQVRAVVDELVTVTETKVTFKPELVAQVTALGEAIGKLVSAIIPVIPPLVLMTVTILKLGASFLTAFTPIAPVIAGLVSALRYLLDAFGPTIVQMLAAAAAAQALAVGIPLVVTAITSLGGAATIMAGALTLAQGAASALWAVLAANPLVAIAAAAVLATKAISALVEAHYNNEAIESWKRAADALGIYIQRVQDKTGVVLEGNQADELFAAGLNRIQKSKAEDYLKLLHDEFGATTVTAEDLNTIIGTVGGSLQQMAKKMKEASDDALFPFEQQLLALKAAGAGIGGGIAGELEAASLHSQHSLNAINKAIDAAIAKASDPALKVALEGMRQSLLAQQSINTSRESGERFIKDQEERAAAIQKETEAWEKLKTKIADEAAVATAGDVIARAYTKNLVDLDKSWTAIEEQAKLHYGKLYAHQEDFQQTMEEAWNAYVGKNQAVTDKDLAAQAKWANEGIKLRQQFWDTVAAISTKGAETESEKIQAAADKEMAGIRQKFGKGAQDLAELLGRELASGDGSVLATLLGVAKFDALMAVLAQQAKTAVDVTSEVTSVALDVARAKELGDWRGYYDALVALARSKGKTQAQAMAEALGPAMRLAKETMVTAAEGIAAASFAAFHAVRSEAQITFEFFSTLYQTGAREFEDLFAAVITGRVDTLKDVLLNAWQSIAKGFSKMLSDMLQKWIATQAAMQDTSFIGTNEQGQPMTREPLAGAYGSVMGVSRYVPATGSSGGGFNYAGAAGGAVQGAAVGAGVGSMSGAPGFATGATIGGLIGGILATTILNALMTTLVTTLSSGLVTGTAAGAAAGPLGMIIGAIIGGLIGVLSAPNTEMHVPFTATAGRQEFSDFYGRPQNTAAGQFLEDITNKISTSLAETFLKADPAGAAGLVDDVNGIISRYIKSMDFEIHAGEKEDILKDFEFLTTNQIPKELMHQLFGNQRVTGQNLAGISGASRYDRVLDPDSPITKMLLSIGVTMEKIGELSDQIDVTDPKVFLDRLKNFVAAIVDANAVVAELKKSYGETRSDIIGQQTASPGAQFKAVADQIVAFAQQIPLYVGDDQLAKMKDLNTMAQQYRQGELQALTALIQLEQQWAASVNALRGAMQDAGKGTDWLNADRWARASANLSGQDFNAGRIAHATTPEELMDLANQTRELIAALFQSIFDQLQRGRALQASMADLSRAFGMGTAGQWDAANKNPFRVLNETQASIAEGLETAWHQTGQAQLDTIQQVHEAAQSMYQQQIALLNTIHSNLVEMQRGFASQIQDWQFSLLHNQGDLDKVNQKIVANLNAIAKTTDPAEKARLEAENRALTTYGATINPREQIDWLKARLEEDKAALATAQTPEEIKRLTDEIQKFTNQYVGMFATSGFGAGGLEADPNRAAAIDWAKQFLGTTQAEATAAYKKMEAEIQAHNVEMQRLLDAGTQLLIDNEWHASQAIGRLTAGLNSLDQQTLNKLHQFGEAVLSDSERVWKAIDDAASHLKTAIDGPQYGAVSAIDRLGAAADAAAERLNKLPSGIVNPTAPTNPVTTPTGTPASASAYTADLFRRNGSRLTMRMTG